MRAPPPPPPPPPASKRKAPPPPPPPRRDDDELAEMRLEDSYVADFCNGLFCNIPPVYLARLHSYCADMGKPEIKRTKDVPGDELMRAVFVHTDYPLVPWVMAAEQLKHTILTKTPFAAVSRRCIEWLDKRLDFDAARERRDSLRGSSDEF